MCRYDRETDNEIEREKNMLWFSMLGDCFGASLITTADKMEKL